MRTAFYARVSTDKQVEKYGIPSQIEALKRRCLERGWTRVNDVGKEAFVDDGYSGSELDRPALNRLREMVREGEVDVVLAYDPDRLSRNLADLLLLESEFTKHGVKLDFITQDMDTSPEGKMFFAIRGAVGQYEREKIKERSLRGLREKARQGKVLGGSCASFGYRYNKDSATLEEKPENAKILRLIFYTFANESLSLQGLANRLNSLHLAPPKGGNRWRASTLGEMLRNETYVGKLHQFRTYRVEPIRKTKAFTKSKRTSGAFRPKEEWVTVSVPPLVSVDMFEAVQRKLGRNAELAKRNTKREYLLAGILYCSRCGGRMGGHTIQGITYYRCRSKDSGDDIPSDTGGQPTRCRCPEVRAVTIEPVVWETISDLIKDPDALVNELRNRKNGTSETREMLERELSLCQSRLKAIPAERGRLVEGYRKGLYADFMMREDMDLIQKEEQDVEARKADLEKQLARSELTASQEVRVKKLVIQLGVGLDNLNFHGRQELLRLLVDKVVYSEHSIEIQTIIPTNRELHPLHRGGHRG
jgi:site-specific DNA recombinase